MTGLVGGSLLGGLGPGPPGPPLNPALGEVCLQTIRPSVRYIIVKKAAPRSPLLGAELLST